MKLKNEKGFSITGMLLVIAIIVVLALLVSSTLGLFESGAENVTSENTVQTEENTITEE